MLTLISFLYIFTVDDINDIIQIFISYCYWLLLMTFTKQMRIEFINVIALLTAYIAFPGIALAMATLMQKIQSFIREFNAAKEACQYLFTI